MLYNSHNHALARLKGLGEAVYVTNISQVIHEKHKIAVLRLVGDDVVVDLSDDLFFAVRSIAEFDSTARSIDRKLKSGV